MTLTADVDTTDSFGQRLSLGADSMLVADIADHSAYFFWLPKL